MLPPVDKLDPVADEQAWDIYEPSMSHWSTIAMMVALAAILLAAAALLLWSVFIGTPFGPDTIGVRR